MADPRPNAGRVTQIASAIDEGGAQTSVSKTQLRLVGVALIALGASHRSAVISTGLISVGLGLAALSIYGHRPSVNGSEIRWAAVAALVSMAGVLGAPIASYPPSIAGTRPLLIVVGSAACVVAFGFGERRVGRVVATALIMAVGLVTIGTLVAQEWGSLFGADVYHAHRSAGEALGNLMNPYTNAVQFEDGNPFAEDRILDGYPYPPVVLLTYGLAAVVTDPRLISAVAWLAFLGWFGWSTIISRSARVSTVSLSLLIVMTLSPLGGLVWYMAWTEPLTLLLFMAAALTWNRFPVGSGLLLGLALASKQYLIFLAPMLLLHRDPGWRRRSVIAAVTAVATVLFGLAPNPGAFIQATIGNLANIGYRPDTQSLPGLAGALGVELLLPNVVWIGLAIAATAFLARSSRTGSQFMIRSGLALGVAFILGLAFPNYWFLVAGLLGLGAVLEVGEAGAALPVEANTA